MLSSAVRSTEHPTAVTPTSVRILIVDDNRAFASLLSSALDTVDGIDCVGCASSAAEGFAKVIELAPSVVVMDLMMPDVDGLTATRHLRQLSPGTAIAVVSAHSHGDWIARAEEAGASAYIPKGGSLDEMLDVLRTARPGPMMVAPSLQEVWASWTRPTPDVMPEDRTSRAPRPATESPRLSSKSRVPTTTRVRHPKLFGLRWQRTNR